LTIHSMCIFSPLSYIYVFLFFIFLFFYSKATSFNRLSNKQYKYIETFELGHSPSIVENQRWEKN